MGLRPEETTPFEGATGNRAAPGGGSDTGAEGSAV
jgi:hypothetical protein